MNAIILIVSVVAPLLPVVMFPTRFIGRGIGSTVLGAALLVGVMMLIYVTMSMTMGSSDDAAPATGKGSSSQAADPDMKALEQLFAN